MMGGNSDHGMLQYVTITSQCRIKCTIIHLGGCGGTFFSYNYVVVVESSYILSNN